jgi:hypothetical protein
MEQHQHQVPSNRKPLGPGNWTVIIIVGCILFYLAWKSGCWPVKTEEKMEWIDR